MAKPNVDLNRAAQAIALSDQFGDEEAARILGVCTRTIRRYRERSERDPELSRAVHDNRKELLAKTKHWAEEADEFMSEALMTMRDKLSDADLRDISTAYKVVGEMTLTRQALMIDDDELSGDSESGATPEDSRQGA